MYKRTTETLMMCSTAIQLCIYTVCIIAVFEKQIHTTLKNRQIIPVAYKALLAS